MTKRIFFIVLFFSVFFLSKAQEDQMQPKNDIGFSTGFFNTGSPFGLMYKRQSSDDMATRYGMTFSVNLNTSRTATVNQTSLGYAAPSSYSFSPSVGKEWQKTFATKWIWYVGGDFRPSISHSKNDTYTVNSQSSILNSSSVSTNYSLTLSPFLGIRFAISKKLYVATEARIALGYNWSKNTNKDFDPNSGTQTSSYEISTSSFSASTSTLASVYAFYRF